jgi:hypothetical protein
MRHPLRLVPLGTILALSGCASYEYVIMHPPEFAGRLTKQERALGDKPVTFHLVDQNSRVGIRVENTSGDSIAVKGDESFVVTPDGRSEPMRSATIASNTWSAFTVPPLIRVYEPSGGVGIGFGVGSWGHHGGGGIGVGYDPFYDPLYLPRDEVAWRWKEGEVRIHLVMEQASDPPTRIERDFTIERRKVE